MVSYSYLWNMFLVGLANYTSSWYLVIQQLLHTFDEAPSQDNNLVSTVELKPQERYGTLTLYPADRMVHTGSRGKEDPPS